MSFHSHLQSPFLRSSSPSSLHDVLLEQNGAGLAQAPTAAGGKVAEARGLQENLCLQDDALSLRLSPFLSIYNVNVRALARTGTPLPRDSSDTQDSSGFLEPSAGEICWRAIS